MLITSVCGTFQLNFCVKMQNKSEWTLLHINSLSIFRKFITVCVDHIYVNKYKSTTGKPNSCKKSNVFTLLHIYRDGYVIIDYIPCVRHNCVTENNYPTFELNSQTTIDILFLRKLFRLETLNPSIVKIVFILLLLYFHTNCFNGVYQKYAQASEIMKIIGSEKINLFNSCILCTKVKILVYLIFKYHFL